MSINKKLTIFVVCIVLLSLHLIIPWLEFDYNNKIYMFSHTDMYYEFEDEYCYSENVAYDKERNISVTGWDFKKVPFGFYMFIYEYEDGNLCEKEYVLEESYIKHFLEDAKIDKESDDVDLEELIKGKKAIVSNKRYSWDDNHKWIGYELDGKHEEMFISTNDDGLLIIQVGLSDEGPKFIAYEEVYSFPKNVDYSKYGFVGKTWTRTTGADTEFLTFRKNGGFSYYCACGSPVDNSDLCEYYTYDGKDTIYVHCDYDKLKKVKVDIISHNDNKLKIKFNGKVREFELEKED